MADGVRDEAIGLRTEQPEALPRTSPPEPRRSEENARTVPPAPHAFLGASSPTDTIPAPQWEGRLRILLGLADTVALLGAVAAGAVLRTDYPVIAGLLLVPAWVAVLAFHSAHDVRHGSSGAVGAKRVADASLRVGLAVVLLSYVASAEAGRGLVLVTLPLGVGLLLLARWAGGSIVRRLRRTGRCVQRVLAVGTVLDVLHLHDQAMRSPSSGFVLAGACVPAYDGNDRRRPAERRAPRPGSETLGNISDRRAEDDRRARVDELGSRGVSVVGEPHEVLAAAQRLGVDSVAVAGHGVLSRQALRRLAWQLEGTRVRLYVASALTEVAAPRITLRPLGGLPLLQVEAPTFSGVSRVLKGVLDRCLATLAVLLLAPVFFALALMIRLDSPGPVLFRQRRIGRNGREFWCLKLRTMRVGADLEVAELEAESDTDGLLFKMRRDPRVTRTGRVLRRLSLDELPQLFNVLGGSMSLVGPRPPLPSEVAKYGDDVRRRLLVKPGMTGLWQVSGRSDLSWAESVRLDLYYVENWSPYLDLAVMARTVSAVLKGRGAY